MTKTPQIAPLAGMAPLGLSKTKAKAAAKAAPKPKGFDKMAADMRAQDTAANRTAKAKDEALHAAANGKALAKPAVAAVAKPAAAPKAERAPKPAVETGKVHFGVAAGAADGQPHTKAAIAAARKDETQTLGDRLAAKFAEPAVNDAFKRSRKRNGDKGLVYVYNGAKDAFAWQPADQPIPRGSKLHWPLPATKEAAPKAKAASAPKAKVERATVAETRKITVNKDYAKPAATPYKEGSKAEATFLLFKKAKTVADFRALVALNPGAYDAGYIRYSSRDGYITIS